MSLGLGWQLAAVPVLIALNGFFVIAEYAVVATKPAQIERMRQRRRAAAASAIARLQSDPASAIGAIQVCITMTNLLLGWIGEPAMSAVLDKFFAPLIELWPRVFHAASLTLSFLIVTLLTVVFSELLPKAMTLRYVELAAALTAVPILWIRRAIHPLVWLMNATANLVTRPLGLGRVEDFEKQHVTLDELRLLAAQAADEGTLTPSERSLILNAMAVGRRRAREIMVHRTRVLFLDLQRSMEENLRIAEQHLHSRMPLCDGGLDHVIGIVPTMEFLTAYHSQADVSMLHLIAAPAFFAPESMTVDKLLAFFRQRRTQMAFVVDEYGGVEGIVTLQDVVDEIVGETGG
jgi:CBS domain containing-hemolysin-like protein